MILGVFVSKVTKLSGEANYFSEAWRKFSAIATLLRKSLGNRLCSRAIREAARVVYPNCV